MEPTWERRDLPVRVSVIIPTYGRSAYLTQAVDSVKAQTWPAHQIIVVDDCSPEPVELDDVLLLRHERNMGPAAARNTGLAHATGDLVLFLDDDDLLLPRRLETAVRELGGHRAHAMAVERFWEDHALILPGRYEGDLRVSIAHSPHPGMGQTVFRREDVVEFDSRLRVAEDREWWLRMRHACDFAWNDQVGMRVRTHPPAKPSHASYKCRLLIAERHLHTLDRPGRALLARDIAAAALVAGERWATARWAAISLLAKPSVLAFKLLARSII